MHSTTTSAPAMLQHTSFRLLAKKLSKEELAESRAQVSTQPDGAQAGSACLMYDAVNCKVFAKAAASFTMDCWRAPAARRALAWAGAQGVSYLHFTKQSVLEENSGHAAILTDTGGLHLTNRNGHELRSWLGPEQLRTWKSRWLWPFQPTRPKTTMFQDLCWLGSDHVIAATCCGTFFSLPRDATESPVPLSISVLGLHKYVRCITCLKGNFKLVVVGDNGAAQVAETSRQLASALSLSIWDLANPAAPCLHALITNQQETEEGGSLLVPLLTLEESLLKCGSNVSWWAPGQLAYAAPFLDMHFLKVLDVTSGRCIVQDDTCQLLPGTRVVCAEASTDTARRLLVWTPHLDPQQDRCNQLATAPNRMRTWMLYSITPIIPIAEPPQADNLPEPPLKRTLSFMNGLFTWATHPWKWPKLSWSKATAIPTTDLSAGAADAIGASNVDQPHGADESPPFAQAHSIVSGMHATNSLRRSISTGSDGAFSIHANSGLAEAQAVPAVPAAAPSPKQPLSLPRRVTWSHELPSTPHDDGGPALAVSHSGEIIVIPELPLQRTSTWPQGSSTRPATAWSEPHLAISNGGDIIPTQPKLEAQPSSGIPSFQAASNAADSSRFHQTYSVKVDEGRGGGDGIQKVTERPWVAAVQRHGQQQQGNSEGKPSWRHGVDARRARVQQRKETTGKRKQACVKHSAVFAILLCLIVPFGFLGPAATSKAATIWQQLGTKTMPAWMEGVVADYLPNLTPWMPDVVPTSGNAALLVPAETDVRPALVLKAHTFDQETRSGTLLTVLKWVPSLIPNPHVPDAATAALPAILSANTPSACTSCTPPVSTLSETQTPLQLTSGRDVPKTAVWSPEKQLLQTLQATAMMIPGLQSVLLGVRDVTPPVPRSIRDVLSLMLHLMPGTVPGASVDSVGEVALAGWEQHAVLNGASFVHLAKSWNKMQRGCRAAFMGTLPTGQDSTPNSADQSGDHYLKTAACLDTHADCPYSDSSTTSQADLVDLGAADLDPLDVSGTNAAPHDSRGSILGAAAQPACIADNAQAPAAILRQYAAFAGSLLMSLTAELQQLMTASTMDAPCSHSTEHHINDMPSLSSDQWLSQADSADGIEELVAAGEHDAAHSSSAQDQLQPAEHVLLSHVDSPWLVSIEISAVLTGAAVNLATQCVDLMLLLPDDPESQPDTVQQAPLPETYLATEKQQSADQNSFGSVAQPHSFSLDMAFFTIYMVIINVCTVCICIVYRNTLK